jgi:predicted RNase H-like nuclease (RuvC/YqgF family)
MNARIVQEKVMTDESRIAKLEADVCHLQSDVTELKELLKRLRDAFDSLRAEVAREFVTVWKELGAIRIAIERAKLWMVITGVGTILSVWGAALALARFLKPS